MVIRAVVFDVGGVLALVEPMDFDRRSEAELGLADGAIGTAMADVWAAGAIGRVTEDEVHQAMRDRLGLTGEQVDTVMGEMWRQYLGVANTELVEYARGLRPAYRTGILSNSFVGAREREHREYGLGDLVEELIYSHEVGMGKPDPGAVGTHLPAYGRGAWRDGVPGQRGATGGERAGVRHRGCAVRAPGIT
jgi:putative hydrolase of the HAD superfamily